MEPYKYATDRQRSILGIKVDIYFYNKFRQKVRQSLQYFLKPFVVSSIGCTFAAVVLSSNSEVCKQIRSESLQRQKVGCPDRVREIIHNNILGKSMAASTLFNYSTLENQKKITDFMVNNMHAPHNHVNQQANMFDLCGITKQLLSSLQCTFQQQQVHPVPSNPNLIVNNQYRNTLLLLLAAMVSSSTQSLDYIMRNAQIDSIIGLARIRGITPSLFQGFVQHIGEQQQPTDESRDMCQGTFYHKNHITSNNESGIGDRQYCDRCRDRVLERNLHLDLDSLHGQQPKETSNVEKYDKFESRHLTDLRILLVSLKPIDECMDHILSTTRKKLHYHRTIRKREKEMRFTYNNILGDFGGPPVASTKPSEEMLLGTCIQSLSVLSTVRANCETIVKYNGLALLSKTVMKNNKDGDGAFSPDQNHPSQPEIKESILTTTTSADSDNRDAIEIARILANITTYPHLCLDVAYSELLPHIVRWVNQRSDLILQCESARVLANLDNTLSIASTGDNNINSSNYNGLGSLDSMRQIYKDGIYLLYPAHNGILNARASKKTTDTDNHDDETQQHNAFSSSTSKSILVRNFENISFLLDLENIPPSPGFGPHHDPPATGSDNEYFFKTNVEPAIDVVFVHGLLGGAFFTWRSEMRIDQKMISSHDTLDDVTDGSSDAVAVAEEESCTGNDQMYLSKHNSPRNINYLRQFSKLEGMDVSDGDEISDSSVKAISIQEITSSQATTPGGENGTLCWPKYWLSESFPNIRILSVEYDTMISDWGALCPAVPATVASRSLKRNANSLRKKLTAAGVGDRPIVFVAHSMGGLLVKAMLVESASSSMASGKKLSDRTKGIVFLGTPHGGSPLADFFLNKFRFLTLPSIEVDELRMNSKLLSRLHKNFIKLKHIQCLSLGEKNATELGGSWGVSVLIVPPTSANPNLGEYEEIDTDHLHICKPSSTHDVRYIKIADFIQRFLSEYEKKKQQ